MFIPNNIKSVESPLVSSFGESFSPYPLPYFGRPVNFPSTPNSFAPFSNLPSGAQTPSVTCTTPLKPVPEIERMDLTADIQQNGVSMVPISPLTVTIPSSSVFSAPKTGFLPVKPSQQSSVVPQVPEKEVSPKPAAASLLAESLNSQRLPAKPSGTRDIPTNANVNVSLLSLLDQESPVYRSSSFFASSPTSEYLDDTLVLRRANNTRPAPQRVLVPARYGIPRIDKADISVHSNHSSDGDNAGSDDERNSRPRLRRSKKTRSSHRPKQRLERDCQDSD